jgi:hypothetical protein
MAHRRDSGLENNRFQLFIWDLTTTNFAVSGGFASANVPLPF